MEMVELSPEAQREQATLRAETERMRVKRLELEAQAAELEDLIGRYASVLERLEAETAPETSTWGTRREELRTILTELAEHTSAVAAVL